MNKAHLFMTSADLFFGFSFFGFSFFRYENLKSDLVTSI